jgi:uncharacterized protein
MTEKPTKKRGFAAMDREKLLAVCSLGGKAVKGEQRAFSTNRALAAEAGRRGGKAVPAESRSFSTNRELAGRAGKKGGAAIAAAVRSFAQNRELARAAGRKGGAAPRTKPTSEGEGDE